MPISHPLPSCFYHFQRTEKKVAPCHHQWKDVATWTCEILLASLIYFFLLVWIWKAAKYLVYIIFFLICIISFYSSISLSSLSFYLSFTSTISYFTAYLLQEAITDSVTFSFWANHIFPGVLNFICHLYGTWICIRFQVLRLKKN